MPPPPKILRTYLDLSEVDHLTENWNRHPDNTDISIDITLVFTYYIT